MLEKFNLLVQNLLDLGILLNKFLCHLFLNLEAVILHIDPSCDKVSQEQHHEDHGSIERKIIDECEGRSVFHRFLKDGDHKFIVPVSHVQDQVNNDPDYAYQKRVFEKSLHVSVFSFTSPPETGFFFLLYSKTRWHDDGLPPFLKSASKEEPQREQTFSVSVAFVPQFGQLL